MLMAIIAIKNCIFDIAKTIEKLRII